MFSNDICRRLAKRQRCCICRHAYPSIKIVAFNLGDGRYDGIDLALTKTLHNFDPIWASVSSIRFALCRLGMQEAVAWMYKDFENKKMKEMCPFYMQ